MAVLGITSDVSVGSRGKYPLTELDQEALYRPLTKWNTTIDRADQIPGAVRAAFRAMTTGRPGTAHLCLPYDVQKHEVDRRRVGPARARPLSGDALRARPRGHRAGRRPPGGRARAGHPVRRRRGHLGACAALEELAVTLNAPVCTTVSGQGSLADTHPLNAGVVGSNGGILATRAVLADADVVLLIGCRAGSTSTEHWRFPSREVPILHIDSDPMVIAANYRTDVAMVGDALLALQALNREVHARIDARPTDAVDGKAVAAKAKGAKLAALQPLAASLDAPIRPERVVDALNRLLPAESVVVADPGTPCPYFSAYFEASKPGRHFITNRAHGALGFSMAAGMGAAIGRPSAKVVSVMGDGSFGFTVGEMETIVRRKVPLLMIVLSNSVYGWIKASQKAGYQERYFSVDFNRTDHARVAEAYGVKAWRVEDPRELDGVLKAAIEYGGPALVDIIVQPLQEAAAPVSQWMG